MITVLQNMVVHSILLTHVEPNIDVATTVRSSIDVKKVDACKHGLP